MFFGYSYFASALNTVSTKIFQLSFIVCLSIKLNSKMIKIVFMIHNNFTS